MGGKILSDLWECEREKRRKAQETMNMASNFQSLEHWRTFFRGATTDIFQVVENSIHIASQDHPAEFPGRCNQLIKRFTDYPQRKNEEKEKVMRIKDLLTANWKEQAEDLIFESLTTLRLMELSVEVLKDTKIEKIIKRLQKHPIKRIKHLAKLLINCWKLLEDEKVNTEKKPKTCYSESVNLFPAKEEGRVSFVFALPAPGQNAGLRATKSDRFNRTASTLHSLAEHIYKVEDVVRQVLPSQVKPDRSYKRVANPQDVPRNPATVTPLPQGFEQNKKCNDQPFEARLETTKRKLQDAYLKEKLAKKQRCIKLIEIVDLPKKDLHHEITDRRCSSKKWTNWQARHPVMPIS